MQGITPKSGFENRELHHQNARLIIHAACAWILPRGPLIHSPCAVILRRLKNGECLSSRAHFCRFVANVSGADDAPPQECRICRMSRPACSILLLLLLMLKLLLLLLCWLFAWPLGRVGKLSVSSGAAAPPDEAEGRQNLPCASNLL